MGLIQSKAENVYVRDRIRLCDGLNPLLGGTVAAGGNGRYVFIIGDKSKRLQHNGTVLTTFKLDYIDLMKSARTRIEYVGGFCNFGMLVGFYALDERTVVLVDFNEAERTMRQRLISVDARGCRAHAWLDRGYKLNSRALFFIGKTAVSEDRVITIAPSLSGRLEPIALVYPKNPLNLSLPARNISPLLLEAGNRVRAGDHGQEAERVNLSAWEAPFFLSPTKIGFFTDRWGSLTVDPSLIVVCDFESNSISIDRSQPDEKTNFPYTKEGAHPYNCRSFTGSRDQLGLLVSHRCPPPKSWRWAVGAVIDQLAKWSFYSCLTLGEIEWKRLSAKFLSLAIFLGLLKCRLLRPPAARIGLMDTRTKQWRELPGAVDSSQFTSMKTSVFHDGHTLIYDRVTEKRVGTREIGANFDKEPTEELRILSNPGRISSLKTLSEMRLRKNVIPRSALEQIAARI